MNPKAYLEITMKIDNSNREKAGKVYFDYREPFLKEIKGALTREKERAFNQRRGCSSNSRI